MHHRAIREDASPTTMQRSDLAETELRHALLTYRLLCYEARTRTICRFTSLSSSQVTSYRKRWGFKVKDRNRGPSPSSFLPFFRTQALREEGAHLALLCKTHLVLSRERSDHLFYTLARGERLCDVLDIHTGAFPQPTYSFEQLVLLVRGLSASVSISMNLCEACGRPVLVDPLDAARPTCTYCNTATSGRALISVGH